ncbi:MAG: phosphatidate cytidylyltransferase [Tardiphaga sp.]|nr:phosphatidate cytidylyltransferase [Tardiphaga sp.]
MSTPPDGSARPAPSGSRNLITRVGVAAILIPLAIAAAWAGGSIWAALVVPIAIGLFVEWVSIVKTASAARPGWIALGGLYATAALAGSLLVRHDQHYGVAALLLVLAVVWASDIGGYVVGKSVGGRKLAPRVSPNKTWAGAIGGFGLSLLVAAGFTVAGQGALMPLLLVAAGLSVVSQAGDLFESAIKRRFGVKDSSHIIPGHGGLLDRLDGFVAAIALAALVGFLRGGVDGVGRGLMVW